MTKFKFGDKVTYRGYGKAIYLRKTDDKRSLIAVEKFGAYKGVVITVITNELTPVSEWIKFSERMPQHGEMELDDVKSPLAEYFVTISRNDGDEVQRAYYMDWISNKGKWVSMNGVPISAKVTHWMPSYTPAPPQD